MMSFSFPPLLVRGFAFVADRLVPFLFFVAIALFHGTAFSLQLDALKSVAGWPMAAPVKALLLVDIAFLGLTVVSSVLTAFFVLGRRPAQSSFAGILPCLVALIGWLGAFGLLTLDLNRAVPTSVRLTGDSLMLLGVVWSLGALLSLGRSFAILPSARRLVTSWAYRTMRHPFYVGEIAIILGLVVRTASLESCAVGGIVIMAQILRMRFEERTLRAAFGKAYEAYETRVGLFGPFGRKRGDLE